VNPFRRSPQGESADTDRPADDFFRDRREAASWMANRAAGMLADAESLSGDEDLRGEAALFASMSSGYSALGALNLALADNGDDDSDLWPSYFTPKPQDGAP
jgi:hypothetical protein